MATYVFQRDSSTTSAVAVAYDMDWQVIEEHLSACPAQADASHSTPERAYLYGPGIDDVLVQHTRASGSSMTALWPQGDLLGSPGLLTTSSEEPHTCYRHRAFGLTNAYPGSAPPADPPLNPSTEDPTFISFTGRHTLVPGAPTESPVILDYRHRIYSPLAGEVPASGPHRVRGRGLELVSVCWKWGGGERGSVGVGEYCLR